MSTATTEHHRDHESTPRRALQRSFSEHRGSSGSSTPSTLQLERRRGSGSSADSGSSEDAALDTGSPATNYTSSPGSAKGESTAKLDQYSVVQPRRAQVAAALTTAPPSMSAFEPTVQSPCFVHSHLDSAVHPDRRRCATPLSSSSSSSSGNPIPNYPHSASPFQTRHAKRREATPPMHHTTTHNLAFSPQGDHDFSSLKTPRLVHRQVPQQQPDDDEASDGSITEEGEDDEASTLTRRLAETATSVREMSKQLGRARVKSNINSIMIITKARDNHLIKLTRELAVWIMTEMRPPTPKERGVIVYVDSQLQKSKRFDAAGIERDNPHLFKPLVRRFSRRSSQSARKSSGLPDLSVTQTHFANKIAPLSTADGSTPSSAQPSPPITPGASTSETEYTASASKDDGQTQKGLLRYWTAEMCQNSPHLFDFVITLGGDGTVLFASWLYQKIVPPIIPFSLGSLGFLTNFDFANYKQTLKSVLEDGVRINLRMRFSCTVYRAVDPAASRRRAIRSGQTGEIFMNDLASDGWDAIEGGQQHGAGSKKDKEVLCFTTKPAEQFEVINDLVVDRGPSPYVSLLELFGDEHHMTTVQADGLCVATPTGSTAYSLSAGGSLVHPESPAILVTPICPHTLSFRPITLPDSMELRICVPYNSRSTAWASFDGRGRVELRQGDHIKITASPYPFPTVCKDKQSTDWFSSIARTLKWNERQRQKSFVVVEEDRAEPREEKKDAVHTNDQKLSGSIKDEDHEEEEEHFDIDDMSSTENSMPPTPERKAEDKQRRPQPLLPLPSGSTLDLGFSDEAGRFKDPAPKPKPISRRHTYHEPEQVHFDETGASVREGETGHRDDLREPPNRYRKPSSSKFKIGRAATEQAEAPSSNPPATNQTASDQLSRRKSDNPRRAFAVFGDDESDASQSDISESL